MLLCLKPVSTSRLGKVEGQKNYIAGQIFLYAFPLYGRLHFTLQQENIPTYRVMQSDWNSLTIDTFRDAITSELMM